MSTPEPFADSDDYVNRGYDASAWPSTAVLSMKLAEASRYLRSQSVYPGIDQDITEDILDEELVKDVVCAMVSRAEPIEGVPIGAESMQVSVDIFHRTIKFSGGGASQLYLSQEDKCKLGIGGQQTYSVGLLPPEDWPEDDPAA